MQFVQCKIIIIIIFNIDLYTENNKVERGRKLFGSETIMPNNLRLYNYDISIIIRYRI